MGYAGDLTSRDAWQFLETEETAVLVDVRTRAEWSFVGIPDLSKLGKEPLLVEWQTFPPGPRPSPFEDDLRAALRQNGKDQEAPLLFLCRSGGRSRAAAMACTEAGFSRCYNVSDGFEGDLGAERHRSSVNGWKHSGLPWVQS